MAFEKLSSALLHCHLAFDDKLVNRHFPPLCKNILGTLHPAFTCSVAGGFKSKRMKKHTSKRNTATILILLSICLSSLYSCSTTKYAYTPSTANLLQLDEKGDFLAAVNYATAAAPVSGERKKQSSGMDLQTAYAVGKKIVVKADAYFKSERNETIATQNSIPYESISYKKKGAEISIGNRNFSKSKDRSPFQAYAGVGLGKFSFTSKYNDGRSNNQHAMHYIKVFIQPSYTFFVAKNYELTFGSKISMLQFSDVVTDYPNLSSTALGYIDTKPNYYLDFIMQHQFAFDKLRGLQFQIQFGLTSLATKFSVPPNLEKERYDYNKTWFAAGFILDAGKISKKK